LLGCSKEALAPVPYSALGQPAIDEHIVGPGDTLAVYVFGVLPPNEDETPVQIRTQTVNQIYYPPGGTETGAKTGLPIAVKADGTIDLPLVQSVPVEGLTVTQVVDKLIEVYGKEKVLQKGRERVSVDLITPRVKRVVVLREDTPSPAVTVVRPGTNTEIHRGSGQVVDLPIYENDVLHALAASGGLPGTDAKQEIWVVRNLPDNMRQYLNVQQLAEMSNNMPSDGLSPEVIRLPLVGCPGAPLPFRVQDVILEDGDVVFLPRRNEYFVTGGLLPGARIPLPRDQDIDVLEAIALATGSVGGPLGQSGSVLASGTPGHMKEPTQVVIVRKLPGDRQFTIRVDLDRAMKDPNERILIQNEDVVMLYFRPAEAIWTSGLNWVNVSVIPN
jgi:protein involved in polysaccharide export with SLBB domain